MSAGQRSKVVLRYEGSLYHVGNAGRFEDVFIRASAAHHHGEFGQSAWSNLEEEEQRDNNVASDGSGEVDVSMGWVGG